MGGWIVTGSVLLGLTTAFVLRTRLPAPAVFTLLVATGLGIAGGGMLLRADPSPGEVVVALFALGVLVPFHVRIVLGPLGPGR